MTNEGKVASNQRVAGWTGGEALSFKLSCILTAEKVRDIRHLLRKKKNGGEESYGLQTSLISILDSIPVLTSPKC